MPMTAKQMLKLLQDNGYVVVGVNGSHHKLRNPETGTTIIVPVHAKDLGKGLEAKILKQAGLK